MSDFTLAKELDIDETKFAELFGYEAESLTEACIGEDTLKETSWG